MPLDFPDPTNPVPTNPTDRARTVRALERWRDNGLDINPHDPNTIDAYISLTHTCVRVNANMLKNLARATRVDSIQSSTDHIETFWVVPTMNFTVEETFHGAKRQRLSVPTEVQRAMVDESALTGRLPDGVTVDFTENIIVDQSCPRNLLGLGVSELRSAVGSRTNFSFGHQRDESPAADESEPWHAEPILPRQPQAHPVPMQPQACPVTVNSMAEDTSPPTRLCEDLVSNIKDAAYLDRWQSMDPNDQTTVEFWTTMVADTLHEGRVVGTDGTITNELTKLPVYKLFPGFLCKLLCDHACYSTLETFSQQLKKMADSGMRLPKDAQVIIQLAEYDIEGNGALDLSSVDLLKRTRFYASTLYKDFVVKRCRARLDVARNTQSRSQKLLILQEVANSKMADTATREEATAIRMLLSPVAGKAERAQYLCENRGVAKILEAWDPSNELLTLVPFLQPFFEFVGATWESFSMGIQMIVETKCEKHVVNPVGVSLLEFYTSLGDSEFEKCLFREVAAFRIKAKPWLPDGSLETPTPIDFSISQWKKVYKTAVKALGPTSKDAALTSMLRCFQQVKDKAKTVEVAVKDTLAAEGTSNVAPSPVATSVAAAPPLLTTLVAAAPSITRHDFEQPQGALDTAVGKADAAPANSEAGVVPTEEPLETACAATQLAASASLEAAEKTVPACAANPLAANPRAATHLLQTHCAANPAAAETTDTLVAEATGPLDFKIDVIVVVSVKKKKICTTIRKQRWWQC